MQRGIDMQHTMAVLKAERVKKGLSLTDMKTRTDIERPTLSCVENQEEANPTVPGNSLLLCPVTCAQSQGSSVAPP
jgi:hypothetical protein